MRERTQDTLDEWIYFLKKSEIKDNFKAKGMQEAQKVLRYENMSPEDPLAYKRHVENKRLEISVTETAMDKGKRKMQIEVAKECLADDLPIEKVVKFSKLTTEEVLALSRGEDIDKEEEED